MENNIKTLERITEQYHQGNINEEGFKNMVELVGSLTGESSSEDYIKVKTCAIRLQTLIKDCGIFSIRRDKYGADQYTMNVHMTLEGCFDMMPTIKDKMIESYTWQKDDFCKYDFYDQDHDIVYSVLLDEDDVELFEIVFDIELSYTHDCEGRVID